MRESPGGLGGRLGAQGGAPRRCGFGGDVNWAGGWPVKAVTDGAIVAEGKNSAKGCGMRR
jgi:hypothetical protein